MVYFWFYCSFSKGPIITFPQEWDHILFQLIPQAANHLGTYIIYSSLVPDPTDFRRKLERSFSTAFASLAPMCLWEDSSCDEVCAVEVPDGSVSDVWPEWHWALGQLLWLSQLATSAWAHTHFPCGCPSAPCARWENSAPCCDFSWMHPTVSPAGSER